jgi:signal transduction histidine kinase
MKIALVFVIIIALQAIVGRFAIMIAGFYDDPPDTAIVIEIWMLISTSAALFVFAAVIHFWIILRLKSLSEAAKNVAKGDFEVSLPDKSKDEIGKLSSDFNVMVQGLKSNEYLNRDFVKNISHELKTPISSIKGYAELIESAADNKELAEYARIIRQESERLSNLSQDLIKISYLDSNVSLGQDDEYLLDEQIRQVLLVMQSLWESKNIEFELDLEEVTVTSNKELTYIVWQNLISNAIKFSPKESVIDISLRCSQDDASKSITFKIKDKGLGMTEEELTQLFNEFFVGDKSRNTRGSGLGMSIAKKIVDKLGGDIKCVSAPKSGTEFTVSLPLNKNQSEKAVN